MGYERRGAHLGPSGTGRAPPCKLPVAGLREVCHGAVRVAPSRTAIALLTPPLWMGGGRTTNTHSPSSSRRARKAERASLSSLPERPGQAFTQRYLELVAGRCKPREGGCDPISRFQYFKISRSIEGGCDRGLLGEHGAAVKSGAYAALTM